MRPLLLFMFAAAACSSTAPNDTSTDQKGSCPASGNPAAFVNVVDDQFQPQVVTVPVCGKVRWNFMAAAQHGVFPWNMTFPASPIESQGVYDYVFPTAGTFDYGCAIHGMKMPGRVIVQ